MLESGTSNGETNTMNHILPFLMAGVISASVARAGDVQVKAVLATSLDGEPVTTATPDTPKLFTLSKTKGAQTATEYAVS